MNSLVRLFPNIGEINPPAVEWVEHVGVSVGVDFASKFEKSCDCGRRGRGAIFGKAISKAGTKVVCRRSGGTPKFGAIGFSEATHIEVLAWGWPLAYVSEPALQRRVSLIHFGGDQEQHSIDAETRSIKCASVVKFDDRRHEPDLRDAA